MQSENKAFFHGCAESECSGSEDESARRSADGGIMKAQRGVHSLRDFASKGKGPWDDYMRYTA